ncbi:MULTISPECIES: helix-turn-helix domain-containing protein [unclassified Blastococcus]
MGLEIATRASDSPWIDSVWTSRSDAVSEMTSVASETWGLVFWEQDGVRHAAVTGPETRSGTAPVPEGAVFVGIQFAVGTALRRTPTPALVDSGLALPDTTSRHFTLHGDRWETPGPDDAEALVERLVRRGVVERDPLVAAALRGSGVPGSDRTVERRFRAATGLTRGAVDQIARARAATTLLLGGATAAGVVAELGYYDEPHLARALRRYVGRTAGQLRSGTGGALALTAQRTTS